MAYRLPEGFERLWTYLPSPLVAQLGRLALRHRRTLAQEFLVAVEEYMERQEEERQKGIWSARDKPRT